MDNNIKMKALLDELISIMEEKEANLQDAKLAIIVLAKAIQKIV